MVFPDYRRLCDTVISESTDFSSNNIPESRYSVPSSLHICGTKYRIRSFKTDNPINMIIQKTTENIKPDTILEVTGDTGVIRLFRKFECIVILV